MDISYFKEYSYNLDRDMEFKVYGTSGLPILAFPAQDGRFFDFENFGMVNSIRDFIESGKVQVFTCDSIDKETYSDTYGNEGYRIFMHERWFKYITEELVYRIREINKTDARIITTGCSMGATHAVNFFLRRPDLFKGCIAMSGVYDIGFFFKNFTDERTYLNSPLHYLANMPTNHPYVEMYRNSDIIISVGQGAWEDPMIYDTHAIKQQFLRLGVPCWIDFWGSDVNHDWCWWLQQFPYFLGHLLNAN